MFNTRLDMTLRIGALVATAALLPSAAAVADDDVPTTLRVHAVGDLAPSLRSALNGVRDPDLVPLGTFRDGTDEGIFLWSWEERFDAGRVAEEVADLLHSVVAETDTSFDHETTSGGMIALRTTAEGHQRADAALALLRRQLDSSVHVNVRALTIDRHALQGDVLALLGHAEAGTLDDAGVQRLVALDRQGGRRAGDLKMELGWWSVLRQVRSVHAVVDLDVEIAESSSISDPIVQTMTDGLRVACLPLSLQDGRILVRTIATTGDIAQPLRQVNLGQRANGSLELPDFHGALVASEIALSRGRTAGVVLWRPGGDARVLLLRLVSAPRNRDGGTLALLPTSALTRAVPSVRVSWGDGLGMEEHAEGVGFLPYEEGAERLTMDAVTSALSHEIMSELDSEAAYVTDTLWFGGSTLLVRASEAGIGRMKRALRELEATAISPVRVSIRIEVRDGNGAPRLVGSLGGPATNGKTLGMGAYRSIAYVADQDVEVAQDARISDPIVRTALAGALANVVVRPVGKDYAVDLTLRVSTVDTAPESIPHGADNVSIVERVVTADRSTSVRLRVSPGTPQEIVLGESAQGGPGQLVAVVRVDPQ